MSDDSLRQYHEYLLRRSKLGELYRRRILYPTLCRHLTGRVLDVGCGIGDFLRYRPDTVGIDINPHNVSFCKMAGLEAYVTTGPFPFSNQYFDGTVLDNVLEHLASPSAILVEIARVLKPKGRLIVGVPGQAGYARDPDHKIFYDEPKLVSTIEAVGFVRVRILKMPLPFLGTLLPQYCLYGIFRRTG